MSTDSTAGPTSAPSTGGAGSAQGRSSEEDRSEIGQRAAYEAELSRITSADLMLQAAVSLLNVGSYRLAPRAAAPVAPGGQAPAAGAAEPSASSAPDLEQARDAIDGARALLEILERSIPSELAPLRNALSQLQMAYARAVQAAGPETRPSGEPGGTPPSSGTSGAPGVDGGSGERQPSGPGPAESSGRLWVPGR
ncbi:MAG TPA: hypothetical protein VGX69_11745 [Solirubrobacteraceae bacterium]|jgi:hypothetical protein|nr:hypothetical protein [Solirubrobacteraceae bacterium]